MATLAEVKARRKVLQGSQRRIIFNDDGAAISRYDPAFGDPISQASWIGYWLGPHRGTGNYISPSPTPSQVDSIVFASWYPGFTFHKSTIPGVFFGNPGATETPPFIDATQELFDNTGKDALQIASEWASTNSMEMYCAFRMNDGHAALKPREELSPILQGFWDSGSLLRNGAVNYLDYSKADVINYILASVDEVLDDKYPISGIELDFYRALGLFDNTAFLESFPSDTTQLMLDTVTGLVQAIRDKMDVRSQALMDAGKEPLLLIVHVPDDQGYAKGCALDVEQWMRLGLVDILVTMGLHQINPVRDTVTWGARFGVPSYTAVVDPRFSPRKSRQGAQGVAARALQALDSGAKGTYWFNYNYPHDPDFFGASSTVWRYSGTAAGIRSATSRKYYPTFADGDTRLISNFTFFPNKAGFYPRHVSLLSPTDPQSSVMVVLKIECYEVPADITSVSLSIDASDFDDTTPLSITLNDVAATWQSNVGVTRNYSIDKTALVSGDNILVVHGGVRVFKITDAELLVT